MSSKKKHWKAMTNPDFLGSWDFEDGEQRTLVIKEIKEGTVTGDGGRQDHCVIGSFTTGLPMILNNTNLKAIQIALKTPNPDEWVGKSIVLEVKNVKAFGDVWPALRVSTTATRQIDPVKKERPILKKDSEEYVKVVKYLQDNKSVDFETAFAGPNSKYKISAPIKSQLEIEHGNDN